jgi:hypothetical protein
MINFFSLLPLATKVLLRKTLFRYPHPLTGKAAVLLLALKVKLLESLFKNFI